MKIKLQLDSLDVQSFATLHRPGPAMGTVRANSIVNTGIVTTDMNTLEVEGACYDERTAIGPTCDCTPGTRCTCNGDTCGCPSYNGLSCPPRCP